MKDLDIVNAWLFTFDNISNIPSEKFIVLKSDHINGRLETPEGTVKVELGDWILQTHNGDYYAVTSQELLDLLKPKVNLSNVKVGTKLILRNGLIAKVTHIMPVETGSPYPITGFVENTTDVFVWSLGGQTIINHASDYDVVATAR